MAATTVPSPSLPLRSEKPTESAASGNGGRDCDPQNAGLASLRTGFESRERMDSSASLRHRQTTRTRRERQERDSFTTFAHCMVPAAQLTRLKGRHGTTGRPSARSLLCCADVETQVAGTAWSVVPPAHFFVRRPTLLFHFMFSFFHIAIPAAASLCLADAAVASASPACSSDSAKLSRCSLGRTQHPSEHTVIKSGHDTGRMARRHASGHCWRASAAKIAFAVQSGSIIAFGSHASISSLR